MTHEVLRADYPKVWTRNSSTFWEIRLSVFYLRSGMGRSISVRAGVRTQYHSMKSGSRGKSALWKHLPTTLKLINNSFSQQILLTCLSRKGTGVNRNINNSSVLLRCSSKSWQCDSVHLIIYTCAFLLCDRSKCLSVCIFMHKKKCENDMWFQVEVCAGTIPSRTIVNPSAVSCCAASPAGVWHVRCGWWPHFSVQTWWYQTQHQHSGKSLLPRKNHKLLFQHLLFVQRKHTRYSVIISELQRC